MRSSESFVSILDSGFSNLMTGIDSISYFQRNPTESDFTVSTWARFDEVDFDGIHIYTELNRNGLRASSASCSISLYSVSQGASWTKTLVANLTPAVHLNGYSVSVVANDLPDLEADITLYIESTITRLGKQYKSAGYFNHFGALDLITRNKNKISFLEITKADE